MDAREVVIIITGLAKAYALYKCIEEGVNHMWTVSAIQMHKYVLSSLLPTLKWCLLFAARNAMIVCDEDATNELKVKTVKYFKGIEKSYEVFTHENYN